MEEKDEGEILADAKSSSCGEGGFVDREEYQISNIEQQLRKAQDTLIDLQLLKIKLEEDHKLNAKIVEQEKELASAGRIKEENEKLKHELFGYRKESGTLKDIIAALKDDLEESTTQLQSKVANSLRKIEQADAIIKSDERHISHHLAKHSHHHEPTSHAAHQPAASSDQAPGSAADISAAKSEPFLKIPEDKKSQENPPVAEAAISVAAAPEQHEGAAPAAPAEPAKADPAAPVMTEEAKPAAPIEAVAVPPSPAATPVAVPEATGQSQNIKTLEADAIAAEDDDEDLQEYEDIKKELEALENESIFHSAGAPQQSAPVPADLPVAAPQANQAASHAAVTNNTTTAPAPVASAASPAAPQPQLSTPPPAAVPSPAPTPPAPVPVAVASPQNVPASNIEAPKEKKKSFWQRRKANKQATIAAVATNTPESSMPEKPKKFLLFFKRKTKNATNNQAPAVAGQAGLGGLAVKAAIFLLILFSGFFAYKITNADKLRTLYTTQAQTAISEASKNDNPAAEIPDGFVKQTPQQRHPEAYVDLPFSDTQWEAYQAPDMGVKINYPKNISFRWRPVGSDYLWFLRKDGYLLKIEKIGGSQSLDSVSANVSKGIKYKADNKTIRGLPTIHLTLQEEMPVKGNVYLVQFEGFIYKIWYRTFEPGENDDDAQRVNKMLESLDFVHISS